MLPGRSQNGVSDYLENIIDVLNEAVVVLDGSYRVVEGSQTFFDAFHLNNVLAIGQSIYEIGEGSWDRAALRLLLEDRVLHSLTVRDYEVMYHLPNGSTKTYSLNARCFCRTDDPEDLILVTLRDVTDLRQAWDLVAEKVLELEARNRDLDNFAHHVAHDLKNPVSSMMGFASLITQYYDRMSREEILENAQEIIHSGRHIKEIIDSLLLLANIDRADDVNFGPVQMHSILEISRKTLDHLLQESHAQFHLPDEWPVAIGYAPWVEAVWTNLISNAIKYGGDPPMIRLGYTQEPASIVFWVEDNGAGLTPEQQEAIFRPFTRFANTDIEGHGLGLSVVQQILERLNGEVVLESELGVGSRFGFRLPKA